MNESEQRLQQEILSLIAHQQGIRVDKLSAEKSLNLDLGIDGEAAIELLLAYSGQFHVDIEPLGAEWDRYFAAEPGWHAILQFLARKRAPRLPLPISQLVASARAGKWIPLSH